MDDEILEKLLTKLIGLTEFGALRWHFAGDVSKAYVTVYKNSRLKLTEQALDITEESADTVRIDARLHNQSLADLINGLHKAARESSGRFRTGQVQAVSASASLLGTCQRLLEDEEQIKLYTCLVCSTQFEPDKALGHLEQSEPAPSKKIHYICQQCVESLGLAEAQGRLDIAVRRSRTMADDPEDPIMGDTLSDLNTSSDLQSPTSATQSVGETVQSKPEKK